MVGDNVETDIRGAIEAGWESILLRYVELGFFFSDKFNELY